MKPTAPIVAEAPEAAELGRLETVIRRAQGGYVAVGKALTEIRDRRLYRTTHRTFEDYCLDRWDLGRSEVYRFMEAGQVAGDLSQIGGAPANVAQACILAPLSTEDRRTVWRAAQEAKGRITAACLERLVEELAGPAAVASGRVQELGAKALAGLTSAEKVAVCADRERSIRRESPPEDRSALVLDRIRRLLGRARKLCGQLGPEGDQLDERIELAMKAAGR